MPAAPTHYLVRVSAMAVGDEQGVERVTTPEDSAEPAVSSAVVTVPNVLSALRLLAVPAFLWALFTHRDGLALMLLMFSGASDFADGVIARRYGQVTRIGQLLDPIADRLYIATTLLGLAWREVIPWWMVGVLVAREVFMVGVLVVAKRHGWVGLPVHYVGKAATFNLLFAFPLLLLATFDGTAGTVGAVLGWAFAWWGMVLYWLAGLLYAAQLRRLLQAPRVAA